MKKLIIASLVLFAFAGTAFGAVVLKKIELAQKDYVGIIYGGTDEIKVYEMKMASSTCYISVNSNTKSLQHNLSCIR